MTTVTDAKSPSAFDFTSAAFVQNPYEEFRRWQDEDPIFWSDTLEGWVVSRYDDVRMILRDPEKFPQSRFFEMATGDSLGREVWTDLNPPEHGDARKTAKDFLQYFRPRRLDPAVRPLIAQRVDQIFRADGPDQVEIFGGIVAPLVARVIADIVGIDGPEVVKAHMDAVHMYLKNARVRTATDEIRQQGQAAGRAVMAELRDRCPVKAHENVGEDLLTILGQGTMPTEEIVLAAAQTLFAGMETTQRGVTNAIFALWSHPRALAAVKADPERLVPVAFEENLRWLTPVSIKARDVGPGAELHGADLVPGQTLYLLLGAANRDPRRFDDPSTFDVHRPEIDHLGFGAGIHLCVGAPLARLIADVLLKYLITRYPSAELVDPDGQFTFDGPVYRGPRKVLLDLHR